MKDQFSGAIFEGILAAAQPKGRGSAFGTTLPFIPVYDPLNPANIMRIPLQKDELDNDDMGIGGPR